MINCAFFAGIREGRTISRAQGSASGYGGVNSASADVHGNVAHATGSNNGGGLARDGLYYPGPGQAIADAQTYDNAGEVAIDIARAQGFYHPLHVAQPAVITYNQNIIPAEQVYQPLSVAPASAESSATTNDGFESSQATATNNGGGVAQSQANTLGNYGKTTTNAKTTGGYNTAASDAKSGLGIASSNSKASGSGFGNSYASSDAQTNGYGVAPIAPIAPIAPPTQVIVEPLIIAAKNQGFYNPATYGSASSNADVRGYGSATSSAKTGPTRRSIHWHFGTAYDIPAGYGAYKSAAPAVYQTPVVYQAAPVAVPYGTANSFANTQGDSTAQSNAKLSPNFSATSSNAKSNIGGSANSNAGINENSYGLYRSGMSGSGILKSTASTNGAGFAGSDTNVHQGVGIAKSTANSSVGGYATAKANADINNHNYNLYRTAGEGAQWGRTISEVKTSGFGSAASNAKTYPFGQKTADSTAKSSGWGSSFANSQSL